MKNLVIDGNNFMFRCALAGHTSAQQFSKDGYVVARFIDGLVQLVADEQPECIIVCWDGGTSSIRRAIHPSYKTGVRKSGVQEMTDTEFRHIMRRAATELFNLLQSMGISNWKVKGVEGDDMVYCACRELGPPITLASTDTDFYQLLDHVEGIARFHNTGIVTKAWFEKEFQFPPALYAYWKAMTGDPGDVVPGVVGIGPVTATDVCRMVAAQLSEYNLDKTQQDSYPVLRVIYDYVSGLPAGDRAHKIIECWFDYVLSWMLIDLDIVKCELSLPKTAIIRAALVDRVLTIYHDGGLLVNSPLGCMKTLMGVKS